MFVDDIRLIRSVLFGEVGGDRGLCLRVFDQVGGPIARHRLARVGQAFHWADVFFGDVDARFVVGALHRCPVDVADDFAGWIGLRFAGGGDLTGHDGDFEALAGLQRFVEMQGGRRCLRVDGGDKVLFVVAILDVESGRGQGACFDVSGEVDRDGGWAQHLHAADLQLR